MGYSIDSISADCYPNSTCLINKFGIRDEATLAKVEADIVLLKSSVLLSQPPAGAFDFAQYRAIHRSLFEDIYDWAGEIRSIDMSKKGTNFVKAADIERLAGNAFSRLNAMDNFTGMERNEFVENIVDFYDVTNMLHPFREGNGRTQRIFFTQLIRNAGYDFSFAAMDPDELMIATIQCSHGVSDHLKQLFREAIQPGAM